MKWRLIDLQQLIFAWQSIKSLQKLEKDPTPRY